MEDEGVEYRQTNGVGETARACVRACVDEVREIGRWKGLNCSII